MLTHLNSLIYWETSPPPSSSSSSSSSFQKHNLFGNIFEVPPEFTELKPIGVGSYGFVCSAKHTRLKMGVAIKKLLQPFQTSDHAKGAYREIRLLKTLKHDNIIQLLDAYISPSDDIYLVTDLFDTDLQHLIDAQSLDLSVVSFFLYQLLRGLKFLHSANVIHRDLKPSNILVNSNCDLKICDFGLARISEPQMTGYIATRYFRAPEVLVSWEKYGQPVDIWSVGCIFAEMLTGQTLFPGNDQVHQILIITERLGTPPQAFIDSTRHESTKAYLVSIPPKKRIPFQEMFPDLPLEAIDLLDRMLVYEAEKRVTAKDALRHPYLEKFHDPSDEPDAPVPFDWEKIRAKLSIQQWRVVMQNELHDFSLQLE